MMAPQDRRLTEVIGVDWKRASLSLTTGSAPWRGGANIQG